MKKFTKLWQLMMILMLTSSVAFAQVSISTADKGANNLNEFQKKELIQKGLATEQEIQEGELSQKAVAYIEKSKEAIAEKSGFIEKDNMVTLKEPSYPSEGDACPGTPIWGLPATGYSSAVTSDVEPGYRVYQQFFGSYVIDSIHWWGLRYFHDGTAWSACNEDPKNFEVIFYSDNGGVPGTAVATFNATISGTNSGLPFAADTLYEYSLVLSSSVTLTDGWISIQENPTGDPNCWFLWGNTGVSATSALQENISTGTLSDVGYPVSLCLYGSFELTDDLITTDITSPNSGFLGNAETVTMEIFNNGSNAQTNFPVSMTFDGTTYNENYVGTLNPGEYTTYSFTQTIDCSTQGQTYSVEACTELAADQAPANDCYTHSFASFAPFDCQWMMIGEDSYGDGWNGGSVEIVQDGISTFSWTGPASTGPDTVYFDIWEGASMDVVWHSGSYDSEVTYDIYALWTPDTVLKFSDGPNPTGTTGIALSCFPPACPEPDTLSTTNIQQTTAKANWTWGGSESLWNLEYGPTGFALGTGTQITGITVTPPPFGSGMPEQVISGLTALTTYDWYVQADCGSGTTSTWVGPITFTTLYPFASYSVPFSSSFESGFDTLANAAGNTTDWVLIDTLQVSPTHSAYNQYGTSNTNILFVTGTVDLTAKVNARLSFDQIAKTEGNYDHCYVEMSIDGGSTYFPIPDTLYMGFGTYAPPSYNNPEGPCFDEDSYALWGTGYEIPDNTWWQNESFNLIPYNTYTDVTFRFRLVSDGSVQRAGWFIDNVVVDEMPACPDPGNLTSTTADPTSEILNWTENGTATTWEIEYGPAGFTPGSGTTISVTSKPYTLTGLTAGTDYDWYLRSDCGTSYSNWVGPDSFTTPPVITLPYDFGFEVNSKGEWFDDQTTNFAWTLRTGGTPSSSTGPSAAYEGDWYVYTETSSPAAEGDTYGLDAYFDFTANSAVSFNFAYSMYGASMGELELQVSSDNGATYDSVWGMAGDQGTDWHLASVDFSAYAGSSVLVRFLGTCGSSYTGDMAVDDIHVFEPLAHDVATVSIDMEGFYTSGTVVTPMATVTNLGTNAETFDVQMDISGGYTSTVTVTALAPSASTQVTFADWTAADGDYTVDVCTQLATDMDNSNDCMTQPLFVRTFDKMVYAYDAYSGGSALPVGPVTFNLNDPGTVMSLADQSAMNFITGGTWANGFWYGTVYDDDTLVLINSSDGTRTSVGALGAGINGLSYDVTTGIMYGYDWDGATAGQSTLFTIDMATGAATAVGATTGGELMINLAIDNNGNAYAVDLYGDTFGSVDLATGVFTPIGPIGFNANYAQDMEFDRMTGDCFMTAYGSQGELRWVDVSTGMSYLVGAFDGGMEVTGFAIPYGYNVAGALTYANTANTPLDHSTARLIAGTTERTMETDCNGIYLFDGIADGTYELNGACAKPWGGLTNFDVIFVKRWIQGLMPLTPLQQMAGDVSESGAPSNLDVIMMKRRIQGLSTPAWSAPDYIFEAQSVTVAGGDVIQGVQSLCSGDVNKSYVPPLDCPDPTNLGATNITSTSADLTWTSNSGNSNIEWGPAGFAPGSGTMVIGVTSPYTLTGLSGATIYDYYVQDICCGGAGLSNWVGPYTFNTPAPPTPYCPAGPTSTSDSNVEQVDITGESGTSISHSGCPGVVGAENLMPFYSVDLKVGNTYTLYVTFGTCGGSYAGYGEVWIDWNNDLVFDPATESVGQSNGTPGTAPWDAPVAFTFTVPAGATVGATGMRVMQHEGSSQTFPLDPCASYTWGSVMDFTVNVIP